MDNFERWVRGTKLRIMRPNAMNKHGVVLEDFGLESMLDKFMSDFIHPISRGFCLFFLLRTNLKMMTELKKLI